MFLPLSCIIFVLLVLRAIRGRRRLPLPPSPGRMCYRRCTARYEEPWKTYAAWSKTLGPLLLLSPIGRPVIIINSAEAATSILERASCQCKPHWPMAELLGRQKNVGFQYYGDRHRKSRKTLHASLSWSSVSGKWAPLLHEQSKELLYEFLVHPESFYVDVQKNIQELIIRFTYGKRPDSQYIELAKEVMSQTGIALQPGRWMVNFIPALSWVPAWMPGAGFQRWAENAKTSFLKMTREPFDEAKKDMLQGRTVSSFVHEALQRIYSHGSGEAEDIVMCAAGSLFSAGTETLTGTVLTFLALIARHPEIQERAYDEIVSVIGRERLPEPADIGSLKYIDCVIQEVHRFNPAIPLVTHSNTTEEKYGGFRIPRKTWIMANTWAMLHDDRVYIEPDKFYPERFQSSDRMSGAPDPRIHVFGFGRRRCPGAQFSNMWLFLIVSRVLRLFEILPDGSICKPIEFSTGLVPVPKPFCINFKPRDNTVELLS